MRTSVELPRSPRGVRSHALILLPYKTRNRFEARLNTKLVMDKRLQGDRKVAPDVVADSTKDTTQNSRIL